MITMGSLFDGIGGFPLAGLQYGIFPLWASEIEPFPIKVTRFHFPDMIHVGDITKLKGAELPPVDILCGGSPCQDLSVAGARAGLSGERSGLFMEQIRLAKEMRAVDVRNGRPNLLVRPRYLVWENVPGAFSSGDPKGEDFRIVLEEITRVKCDTVSVPRPESGRWESSGGIVLGNAFSLCWRVLDAQYWGVAQRRCRIFLVADFAGLTAFQILFEQDRLPGYPAPRFRAWEGITFAAQSRIDDSGWPNKEYKGQGTVTAFAANQRDEVRDLHDLAGALGSQPGMKQQTFVSVAFSAGAGSSAGSIGFTEEGTPTLKGSDGGNMVPAVLCLNDQGGKSIETHHNVSGALRSQEHGHQPLIVFENYSLDSRYTDFHSVTPALSGHCGTGCNNNPLIGEDEPDTYCITGNAIDRQPQNGGNGLGYQTGIAYTLTATDHHAVFNRQKIDLFQIADVASTESARQNKDATDLIMQVEEETTPKLIRRLTPLECERLQGFPDGWTDIEGASDSARYKAIGNSVAIPCVEYIMAGIAAALA